MGDRKDLHLVVGHAIRQVVRKPIDPHSTEAVATRFDWRAGRRPVSKGSEDFLDGLEELIAKTPTPTVIPPGRLVEFG